MPRVHKVDKARKDDPHNGIKVGDTYYWWKFKNRVGNGTVVKSLTPPKASQLTRSEFAGRWRSIEEQISELPLDESLHEALQSIAGDLHELADEQDEKFNNMPEGLQQGDTGQLLEARRDAANEWADALEGLDEPEAPGYEDEPVKDDDETDDQFDERYSEWESEQENIASEYQSSLENLKEEAEGSNPGEP